MQLPGAVPPREAGERIGKALPVPLSTSLEEAAVQNSKRCDFWRAAAKGPLTNFWVVLLHTKPLDPNPPRVLFEFVDWLLSTGWQGLEIVCGKLAPHRLA